MNDLYFGPLYTPIPKWAEKYYQNQDSEATPSVSQAQAAFDSTCGPFPHSKYITNRVECDNIVASNPKNEFRVKMCQEHINNTDPDVNVNRDRTWCSMYAGSFDILKGILPEYASCILPNRRFDMTQPKCAQACKGSPDQTGCNRPAPILKIYKSPEVIFSEKCNPFPYTKYATNLAECDYLATANPAKEFRMNMCAATLANPAASNPARWCSMYPGNNQSTGTVLPEYARCIKANGYVDMTKPRCANACKGKPGQNGCPGRPLAAK